MPLAKITGVSRLFETASAKGPAQANRDFRFLRALLGWAMWKYAREDGTSLVPANPCDILNKMKLWNHDERLGKTYKEWLQRRGEAERATSVPAKQVTIMPEEFRLYCVQIGQVPNYSVLEALAAKKAREAT